MATKLPSNDLLTLDPEDELTRPEVRPALRAAHSVVGTLGDSASGLGALGLLPPPELAPPGHAPPDADPADDEVTQVDPRSRRLVSVESLPPPPDFPELE